MKKTKTTKRKPTTTTKSKTTKKTPGKAKAKGKGTGSKLAAHKIHETMALLKAKPARKARQLKKNEKKARPALQSKSQKARRNLFDTKVTPQGTVVTLGVSDPNAGLPHHLAADVEAERSTAHAVNEVVEKRAFKNQLKAAHKSAPLKQPPVHAIGHGRNSRLA